MFIFGIPLFNVTRGKFPGFWWKVHPRWCSLQIRLYISLHRIGLWLRPCIQEARFPLVLLHPKGAALHKGAHKAEKNCRNHECSAASKQCNHNLARSYMTGETNREREGRDVRAGTGDTTWACAVLTHDDETIIGMHP